MDVLSSKKLSDPIAVKLVRKQQGWTQKRLAAELRKTPVTVQRWEIGLRKPSPEIWEKLGALADSLDLADYCAERAGLPDGSGVYLKNPPGPYFSDQARARQISAATKPEPRPSGSGYTPRVRARDTIVRAAAVLFECATEGVQFADQELHHYAEELQERAGHASRLKELIPVKQSQVRSVQVPLYADVVAAGKARKVSEKDVECFIAVPARYAPKGSKSYIGLRVKGDSMEPKLKDGSVVVVDISRKDPLSLKGKIVAARYEGGVVIKKLARASKPRHLIFQSENPEYDDIVLEDQEENPIIGDVVFWWGVQ